MLAQLDTHLDDGRQLSLTLILSTVFYFISVLGSNKYKPVLFVFCTLFFFKQLIMLCGSRLHGESISLNKQATSKNTNSIHFFQKDIHNPDISLHEQ